MTPKEPKEGLGAWMAVIERHAHEAEVAQRKAMEAMQSAMPTIKDAVTKMDNADLVDYVVKLQFEGRSLFDPCVALWDELREFVSAELLRRLNRVDDPKAGE